MGDREHLDLEKHCDLTWIAVSGPLVSECGPLTWVEEVGVGPLLLIVVQRPQVDDHPGSFSHGEISKAAATAEGTSLWYLGPQA